MIYLDKKYGGHVEGEPGSTLCGLDTRTLDSSDDEGYMVTCDACLGIKNVTPAVPVEGGELLRDFEDHLTRLKEPGGSTPSQYALPDGAEELQDIIEFRGMNFALGNIFKACYRAGHCDHSDELREARKVLWFAQREVNRLKRGEI